MARCPRCYVFHLSLNPKVRLCDECENSIPELDDETKQEVNEILAGKEDEEKRDEQAQQN